jgi:hypothetical protein
MNIANSILIVFFGVAADVDALRNNPSVASVREVLHGAEVRIIHVRDWHLVPKKDFAIDTELEGKELEDAYAKHLESVEAVQRSQLGVLSGTKEVFGEGLTEENYPIFKAEIRVLRPFHLELAKHDPYASDESYRIFEEHHLTLLRIGAAGRLMLDEKLTVMPCEGKEYETRPIKHGKIVLDKKAIEAREDAIVRNLLKYEGTVYLVLGGAHDLSDNIKRLSKDCGYIVVTPKGYSE